MVAIAAHHSTVHGISKVPQNKCCLSKGTKAPPLSTIPKDTDMTFRREAAFIFVNRHRMTFDLVVLFKH